MGAIAAKCFEVVFPSSYLSMWVSYVSYIFGQFDFPHVRSWNVSLVDQWTNEQLLFRILFIMSLFWVKLAYHLWYKYEYFYFNRRHINLDHFALYESKSKLVFELFVGSRAYTGFPGFLYIF